MTASASASGRKTPVAVEIGPLRERFYTGIPNVVAEICARLLKEDSLELYFDLDGHWIDSESVRRCLAERSGSSLGIAPDRFASSIAMRDHLRNTGAMRSAVGLFTDHRPPRKVYPREGKIVYDLSMVLMPECHPATSVQMYTADLAEQIACSDVLFPISEATARDLAWLYKVPRERLQVALLGSDVDVTRVARMRERIGHRKVEPFLLILGSIEPRKNTALVLRWLREHPEVMDEFRIVFAGRQAWGETFASLLEASGLQDAAQRGRIVFTGYVDEDFRTALLVGATALLYPSLFEGFGLPLLEAMSIGTPVLSSVSSSMPEIVGENGYYFDPYDSSSLHAAYCRLQADLKSGTLNVIITSAKQAAKQFSYDSTYQVILKSLINPGQTSPC